MYLYVGSIIWNNFYHLEDAADIKPQNLDLSSLILYIVYPSASSFHSALSAVEANFIWKGGHIWEETTENQGGLKEGKLQEKQNKISGIRGLIVVDSLLPILATSFKWNLYLKESHLICLASLLVEIQEPWVVTIDWDNIVVLEGNYEIRNTSPSSSQIDSGDLGKSFCPWTGLNFLIYKVRIESMLFKILWFKI